MSKKIYWNIVLFFVVLCQGIIGKLSEKEESSELLVRQKRVVNLVPGRDVRMSIRHFPYLVAVKRLRRLDFCAGVILSQHIVLTVAQCVVYPTESLRVYSGNAQIPQHGHSLVHTITEKKIKLGDYNHRPNDGIALLSITPFFVYSVNTHFIGLYQGPVQPPLYGIVTGWGCNPVGHPGTEYPDRARSITVPIISNNVCEQMYMNTLPISESDICTHDATGYQYCGLQDAGAPLVFQVNHVYKLVGIHLWNGGVIDRSNPDVFVNLQYPGYKNWLSETMPIMQANVNYPNQNQTLPLTPRIQQHPHSRQTPQSQQNPHNQRR